LSNIFNDDFRDFIQILNKWKVEYMLVGGYAVILNGYRRTTGDMDVWVNRTTDNHGKLVKAMREFGLPTLEVNKQDFLENDLIDVFSYGVPPVSIDILNKLKGVNFEEAYTQSQTIEEDGLTIRFIHVSQLIQAKRAAGRFKDLDDIDKLTSTE
jgi:hypothetical protein